MKRRVWLAGAGAMVLALAGLGLSSGIGGEAVKIASKKLEVQRGLGAREKACIECHSREEPGKVNDWVRSIHARSNVTCIDCHLAKATDRGAMDCPGTKKMSGVKITPVVSPKVCGRCHPGEEQEFALSKHARTWAIQTREIKDPWLKGMASDIERAVGCYVCHGSDLSSGKLTTENWPNTGCGRINPDGSFGSCVICHTTHRFSIAEARKPETCGQCHLGPDHPQDEIYFESKHGKRYLAEHGEWNFAAAPDAWEPGDYSTPTCAVCHMSGIGPLSTTHNVGARLKWETQAALTVPNKDLDGVKARKEMTAVCTQCHSPRWAKNYLDRYDRVVVHYNDAYYKPVKKVMDDLYAKKSLSKWPMFDEEIEWAFYEYWHHEGRRARMGSAMMGPDYSWWHGFYDLKKGYLHIMRLAEEVKRTGNGGPVWIPGADGANLTSEQAAQAAVEWKRMKGVLGVPAK